MALQQVYRELLGCLGDSPIYLSLFAITHQFLKQYDISTYGQLAITLFRKKHKLALGLLVVKEGDRRTVAHVGLGFVCLSVCLSVCFAYLFSV